MIVSESFARQQWPGIRIRSDSDWRDGASKDTVVGVVGNAHINALSDDDATEQYWPAQPDDMPDMVVHGPDGRRAGQPSAHRQVDQRKPGSQDVSGDQADQGSVSRQCLKRIEKTAMAVSADRDGGGFGRRHRHHRPGGIHRFAADQGDCDPYGAGSRKAQVLAAVLRQFVWPVAIGMAVGAGIAGAASRVLRIALYGVSNLDPASYAAAILVLLAIVGIAALLPARRALRLDLAKTLHYD